MKTILGALSLLMLSLPLGAAELLDSYTARLSEQDHYSSKGVRLTTPAAIIRQDRANYHKFRLRDKEDQGDSFFSSVENRDLLEKYLERGKFKGFERRIIVNGDPLVLVEIFRSDSGSVYVDVSLAE